MEWINKNNVQALSIKENKINIIMLDGVNVEVVVDKDKLKDYAEDLAIRLQLTELK